VNRLSYRIRFSCNYEYLLF